ncbi:inositol 1,4,5-triphosphate receptor associated 2 isoform X2 [Rhinichthys klamathensis goyatoka]|uniref:inositol 1,4,5-triphosphate receptor associated 2 isoform X2 n=1 Tax=Rhinichthys klamathensis goyatoka TaxID=3034132 RepID=UPI0024B5A08F|nr:inositol 1,4,5-triphosphate receptor associated 2 isoform X2 [Rhinichthys klamathensis goyatoka]
MNDYTGILGDSDDSDDDPNSKNLLAASWEKLSVTDRMGLKSVEMTEDEVESAFTQFALGFGCDQYTLTQRLQAERHERVVAEENLQRELLHTREMLQVLYERLPDVDSREMVEQMKNSLQMLESNVDTVVKTAEMLGAAHQEARVSHAVEMMSVHVEHLKRRHASESEEMLEARKMLHRRKRRLHSDSTDDRDLFRYSSQQPTRRRVSITLLPTQSELKHLEASFLENCETSADANTELDTQADRRQEVNSPVNSLNQDDDGDSGVFQSVTQIMCRRRRYSPIKPKESSCEGEESEQGEESERGEESNPELRLVARRRPLVSWRSPYRWIVRVFGLIMLMATLLYVFVIAGDVTRLGPAPRARS